MTVNTPLRAESAVPAPRSQRLSRATHAPHEVLDCLVKAHAPFDSIKGFSRFVTAQYHFQAELAPLYNDPRLIARFAGLPDRCRAQQALADLADLGVKPPVPVPGAPGGLSFAESLGWLFVSEGSKLGAAFLIKRAEALGLSAAYGARHLGEPQGGRAASWKAFIQALDGLALAGPEERLAEAGALAAFERFTVVLQAAFAHAEA
jgi:heme oxygenase